MGYLIVDRQRIIDAIERRTVNGDPRVVFYEALLSCDSFSSYIQFLGGNLSVKPSTTQYRVTARMEYFYALRDRHLIKELGPDNREDADAKAEAEIVESDLPPTEKERLIKSRRGQGIFRERVLSIEPSCRLTCVSDPRFLIASHILPWAMATNQQRLDGSNGLMLAPHIDHLFDCGFITFENNGDIKVAHEAAPILKAWGVSVRTSRPLTSEQAEYMEYHRKSIFRGR